MKHNRLYNDLAQWFPVLTPPEEYAEEARQWRDVLREKLGPGRHRILELGVGGGHNLSHLTGEFDATAVDLSPAMLEHCRRLNPTVDCHEGDMRSVRLGRTFDAVLIHDAVSYLLSEDDIRATLATANAHLRSGGALLMAPDDFRETFTDHEICHSKHGAGSSHLTYIEYTHDPDPSDTSIESVMFFLIRRDGQLTIEQDRHMLGLFSQTRWLELMRQSGFSAEKRSYALEAGSQWHMLIGVVQGH